MATTIAYGANRRMTLVITALLAIAMYNCLVLYFWIFTFYKRFRGKYFWTMMCATTGVLWYSIFATLIGFQVGSAKANVVMQAFGYVFMTTGVALILYSRLDLVTRGKIVLFVLWMIIITTCCINIPLAALFAAAFWTKKVATVALVFEKMGILFSCIRELIITAIFMWEAKRNLKSLLDAKGEEGKRMFYSLMVVLGIVIFLDASILVCNFANYKPIKLAYGGITNSVKVMMEFAILNRLINLIQSPTTICQQGGIPDISLPSNPNPNRNSVSHGQRNAPSPLYPGSGAHEHPDEYKQRRSSDPESNTDTVTYRHEECLESSSQEHYHAMSRETTDATVATPERSLSWDHITHSGSHGSGTTEADSSSKESPLRMV
ncbi:hypothetical protein BDW42DRAFT_201583 [Aspergillus taichungensis]|uniref:DUF7703 domain-containing protein n=1 Tax=Aspergillus taichungensis TaxID=482145 RepID=A0A2J5HR72_9EURO|nr:hypothetical protein BDW42DRAFT_201583 [Aspergillus taichungensis]